MEKVEIYGLKEDKKKPRFRYKKYLYIPYILGIIAAFLLMFRFDFQIAQSVNGMRNERLDFFLKLFTFIAMQIFIMVAASVIVFLNSKKNMLKMWLGIASSAVITIALKIIIARPRPFVEGITTSIDLIRTSYTSWDFSFPSMHAVSLFAALPFLPKKWLIPWLIISLLILFTRIYFGLHYTSDILFGAMLGFSSSYLIMKKIK